MQRELFAFLAAASASSCGTPRGPGFDPNGGSASAPPTVSRGAEAGAAELDADGGASVGVGPDGGRVDRLFFAVVGDTRPANIDDTNAYPLGILRAIYQGVQSLKPAPLFAVSTGDYMFASMRGGQAAPQLDLYLSARGVFSGVVFPAMGNHECTGATASNCGAFLADGTPDTYVQFLGKLLAPLGVHLPYYTVRVDSHHGEWTAKLVVVAANAWDDAQASWLQSTLAQPTTYTFVVRHEPAAASTAPGVGPSEQIMARYPVTLAIVGHSHTYGRSGPREVIFGNGGAPLSGTGKNYGFGLIEQRADGAIQVDAIDYASQRRDAAFTFAVNADGSPAP